MNIPELISEWPEVAVLFDAVDQTWRHEVASWPFPWRKRWGDRVAALSGAGMSLFDAEVSAHAEVVDLRENPKKVAAISPRVVKDAVARPRMVRRGKKVAAGQTEMFGESDGNEASTTYQMENKS